MFSLRTFRQSTLLRSATSSTNRVAVSGRRLYSDYGSGEANPDTPNPAVDKEHPGPPPPNAKGKGEQQQQQDSSASKGNDSDSSKSTSGPQPKILAANPPAQGEEPEDVARHNREMQQRADRPQEKVASEDAAEDKVPKGWWSGTGGVDKGP
ncbi:Hypothetical predicted protein [Lecanosticta acicola]|uniref:Uncharacterized protein n=1 Tax=Lecanosticta acicola TaxID=111012 RepID=A0AAI9E949_9PEZI|nr:Hypothetical predicted protein [Lecanosticta acicola]